MKRTLEHDDQEVQLTTDKRIKSSSKASITCPESNLEENSNLEQSSWSKKGKASSKKKTAKQRSFEDADVDPDVDDVDELSRSKARRGHKKGQVPDGEKRLRRFRENAPSSYQDTYARAMTQRMFVIERTRSGTEECPEEIVGLAGTTGNVYTIHIQRVPSCDCPHATKGNQCKHIIYVMSKVLKAPEHLQYQLALLTSELREVLASAPPILSEDNTSRDGNRKPVEGDCPICCSEFEHDEEIVWCKAACGNNVHKECFGQWAATRKGQSGGITCPFCRTPWVGDEDMLKRIAKAGRKNAEGYVNVAAELGLSGQRDYSTYHPFWVRSQQRRGVDVGDWMDPRWES